MNKTVISIDELSVAYKIYGKPVDFVKELIFGGIRHDTFWALRNINLKIHEGERVGIVGPNGAGKSTLLKTIVGAISPTNGSIQVNGEISSLLSLVPSWNLEDSGVENIEFNLMMQGVSPTRINEIKEDIIEFTDLGPFIYSPVKTYSSGMSARLSFAIATAVEPDILIIDEVLGTGDGYFAGRATKRLQEMCRKGRALLFVSHATTAVRMMCDRCIWIENGVVRLDGPTEVVLRQYEEDMMRQDEASNRAATKKRLAKQIKLASPDEVLIASEWRVRIRPSHGGGFVDTHYLRDICCVLGADEMQIPLETKGDASASGAYLDTQSCEWGRLFERGAKECRMLTSRSGMRPGGHVCIKRPPKLGGDGADFHLSFWVSSLLGTEDLVVEVLHAEQGTWLPLAVTRKTEGSWTWYLTEGHLPALPGIEPQQLRDRALLALRRPVEIAKIMVLFEGKEVLSVPELKPFSIAIEVDHHERMPEVSVNINVVRSDGTYVFYQPSGLNNNNIVNHLGKSHIEFSFPENPFAPGDYELNVFVTNGFSWENCPPSDIFDRSMGWVKFRIDQTRPIPFGMINSVVPVSIKTYIPEDFLTSTLANPNQLPVAFPPPYRKMIAFNSDVEWTSWRAQLDLFKIFADRNLETAFSYWFFADPEATWRMFEIDGTPSQYAGPAADLIRAGLLDTLHSYGGVVNGRGTPFKRSEIAKAVHAFQGMGLTAEIYSNHGGLQDVQNIGGPWCTNRDNGIDGSNYQLGDVIGSEAYHMDLTPNLGVRFYWLDVDCVTNNLLQIESSEEGNASLFTTQLSRDGIPMVRFRRSNLGQKPMPQEIGKQISSFLEEKGEGYQIVYNHFGFARSGDGKPGPNVPPYFGTDGYAALDALACAQADGKVLVTTTKRLLAHAFFQLTKPWNITCHGKSVDVHFADEMAYGEVRLPLRWSDIEGFAIPAEGLDSVTLVLGGVSRQAEFWVVDGHRYAGVRWTSIEINEVVNTVMQHGI
jgi:lipopolysaccharide transport system ATP-binding protein